MIFSSPLNAPAADEQDVSRVDLNIFLVGVLASAGGGTLATVPSNILSSAAGLPRPKRRA